YGSYAWWSAGDTGNQIMCNSALTPIRSTATFASGGGTTTAVGANLAANGCNFDFASWGFGTRTIWNPVRNLDGGVEVLYQQINQNMDPARILWAAGGAGTRPTGLYVPADLGAWTGMLRLQRNFYP